MFFMKGMMGYYVCYIMHNYGTLNDAALRLTRVEVTLSKNQDQDFQVFLSTRSH